MKISHTIKDVAHQIANTPFIESFYINGETLDLKAAKEWVVDTHEKMIREGVSVNSVIFYIDDAQFKNRILIIDTSPYLDNVLVKDESLVETMKDLPMSKETHGSFVVKGTVLIFITEEGVPIKIATYSTQNEAIKTCEHHNNYLVSVGCRATVVE